MMDTPSRIIFIPRKFQEQAIAADHPNNLYDAHVQQVKLARMFDQWIR
jgi:hypothetical protein